jgi:hypothetical protein
MMSKFCATAVLAVLLVAIGAPAGTAAPLTFPSGFVVVKSAVLSAPKGARTHGSVKCPGSERPSGGGAFVRSKSLKQNLASSYPNGQRWEVAVNNTSGADTTFRVYAVCLTNAASYSVVTSTTTLPAGGLITGTATCPSGRVVLGGGARSLTSSTHVDIHSFAAASSTTWFADVSNRSTATVSFKVYAICRSKPAGYSLATGSAVTNPPSTQTKATVACPGNGVAIGGGGTSNSVLTDINLNTSIPANFGWSVYENNASSSPATVTALAVCAGT